MQWTDLRDRVGAVTLLGSGCEGDNLGPDTIRRLACDARIIPTVLGTHGQVVELGRAHRWYTSAQAQALWLRDRHCTYPGCTIPAQWCDAHHLIHWADGGPTDLSNAALLCGHHHQHVHTQHVAARFQPDGRVQWNLIPDSYFHTLVPP